MFDKLQKACCFVTKRCNLNCRGCKAHSQNSNDMSTDEWLRAFEVLHSIGVGFAVMLGGEPTMRDDLPDIVRGLNAFGKLPYTIITNSKRLVEDSDYFDTFIDAKPQSVSVSINSLYTHNKAHGDQLKSSYGSDLIDKLITHNYEGELVANIVVHRENIHEIPYMVRILTRAGIWSILTLFHAANDPYYTWRGKVTNVTKDLMFRPEDSGDLEKVANFLITNSPKLKLHNGTDYFSKWSTTGITQDWHCEVMSCISVLEDGRLSCCVDAPPSNVSIFDIGDNAERKLLELSASCPGCFWDHEYESGLYSACPDKGKQIFAHVTKAV